MQTKVSLTLLTTLLLPGCYLGHVASGQWELLSARESIPEVLAAPDTPPDVRERLELVARVLQFSERLGLEVDEQYTQYTPWPGDHVVTTVVATRAGEVEPASFWFPIVGRVPYKGYFDPELANAEAERLLEDGFDVCVSPIRAYSTLGWFDDPVTGPMLRLEPGELAETLVHELVHATVYAPDHAAFNESLATFIGEEARVAFYATEEGPAGAAREREQVEMRRRLRGELETARSDVEQLYASSPGGPERDAARRALEASVRSRIAAMEVRGDAQALSQRLRLNDACLAIAGTYGSELDRFRTRLSALGGDLRALLSQAREAAEHENPLDALLDPKTPH